MRESPRVYSVSWLGLFGLGGIALPPLGVILNARLAPDTRALVLRHELVHWEQARRYGWLGFYLRYVWEWVRAGFSYTNHPMEREAEQGE